MKRSSWMRRPLPNRCSFGSGIRSTVVTSSRSRRSQPFGSTRRASSRDAPGSRSWSRRQRASFAGMSFCGDWRSTAGAPEASSPYTEVCGQYSSTTRWPTRRPDNVVGAPSTGDVASAATSSNANSVASLYVAEVGPASISDTTRSPNDHAPASVIPAHGRTNPCVVRASPKGGRPGP